ncbi:MAG TPA: histidine kinase, partial [Povalibacter sp.]|nr:histidine kinase [Povalibacter sp.]
ALALWVELNGARRAVREEITAGNVVALQLLSRVAWIYANTGPGPLLEFLQQLGRVRSNEISLHTASGEILYQSPPATYKSGREAPAWFAKMLLPEPSSHSFAFADGAELTVTANASRAVLDGWDSITHLLLFSLVAFVVLNGLVFWLVGRALAPLPVIASGLSRIEQGDLTYRLAPMTGYEAGVIGHAFNRMAQAVQEKVQAEHKARDAEARLEERREWSRLIDQRIEEERRLIARELHDEFGQSVTAIRSLAMAIAAQAPRDEQRTQEAARLISTEAARLYDAMHGLIPRLAPLELDTLGLAETLEGLVKHWQERHPAVTLSLQQNLSTELGTGVTLTLYRIVQEGLINALRHGQPSHVNVEIDCDSQRVRVRVADDGTGLPADWSRSGRFGLRGLLERVTQRGGTLSVGNRTPRGVELLADIPLESAA